MAERVIVGMSGGVDSSAAVILLKKQGYEVIGITFKFIDDFDACDAIEVANKLGIEHHIADYRKEFKNMVINSFIDDYNKGITPNPCVHCNKNVKMKFLYDQMIKYNCDYMATGHYARNIRGKLYRSVDLKKDQTYFLSLVPQKILGKTLFPLEGLDKETVRMVARDAGLSVANKKDSTDVCFITSSFNDFMKNHIEEKSGDIVNMTSKEIIGKHHGLPFYTIGQRRGLNLGGNNKRMFVCGKDIENNILYVADSDNEEYLLSDECIIQDVNLISYHHPTFGTAKFRYLSKEMPVTIEYLENNHVRVVYCSGAKSVTPGQTCALYLGEECIGGGIIKEVRKNGKKLWYL